VSRTEILERIGQILSDMGVERPVAPETRIGDDLELDSLRRIELVIEIENRFRVILEPEDEARIRTLGELADVISHRRATDA
jgi:acyl carrier protein